MKGGVRCEGTVVAVVALAAVVVGVEVAVVEVVAAVELVLATPLIVVAGRGVPAVCFGLSPMAPAREKKINNIKQKAKAFIIAVTKTDV